MGVGTLTTVAIARFAVVVTVACIGCAGTARAPHSDDAVVVVQSPVKDAEVWVNDRYIGVVSDLPGGFSVAPGTHFVTVRHDNYHTLYATLVLTARERRRLSAPLAKILP